MLKQVDQAPNMATTATAMMIEATSPSINEMPRVRRLILVPITRPGKDLSATARILGAGLRLYEVCVAATAEGQLVAQHRTAEVAATMALLTASCESYRYASRRCSDAGAAGAGVRRGSRVCAGIDSAVVVEVARYVVALPVLNVVRLREIAGATVFAIVDSEATRVWSAGARCASVCDRQLNIVSRIAVGSRVWIVEPESDLTSCSAACISTRIDDHLAVRRILQLAARKVVVARLEDQRLDSCCLIPVIPPPVVRVIRARHCVGILEAIVIQLITAASALKLAAVARVNRGAVSPVGVLVDAR